MRKSESSLGQGTILAPLLFCIAISDLPNAIENGESDLFADDMNETVVDNDRTVIVAKLQEDATKVGYTRTKSHWRKARQHFFSQTIAKGKETT